MSVANRLLNRLQAFANHLEDNGEMYVETIYKSWCPKCNKHNYVSAGDMRDPTGHDPTRIMCPHCNFVYDIVDDEDCDWDDEDSDPSDYDVGRASLE